SVGEKFDLGKSSLHDSFKRIVNAINNLADSLIAWPTQDEMNDLKHKFLQIGPLPDVIGAIDGTHIPIKAPKDNSCYYITRKKEYAITLQAVYDTNLVFRNCFVGFAGSVHDKRIFVRSDLWTEVGRNKRNFFPHNEYILGDKAYPVLSWCIPPYIDRGNLTPVSLGSQPCFKRP
ncbi:PREDICTED: putative nuclease HARBI1, partial [Trachymyrmex cornetzi]|uniref:putative nuclease HARBI1 n=1 Tax=Trachymyrmex cornetzi TaxID=471704 RepID=UPI00084F0010